MPDDDQRLIQQIARGDPQALRLLYDAYQPQLYRYLWHQLSGDRQAVEDVLQEIFLAIWSTASNFRGDALPKTWIFRIAHYQVTRIVRERMLQAQRSAAFVFDEDAQMEQSAPSDEDAILDRLALADALQRISAKHREVLELLFLQDCSLEEIAAILEVPLGTVKSRISYGRRALLHAMQTVASEGEPAR